MSARRLTLATLVLLCAVAAGAPAPAQAAATHEYLSQITEVPASSGAAVTGPLESALGMTVDSGSLYVSERLSSPPVPGHYHEVLNKFDASSGAFTTQVYHRLAPEGGPESGELDVRLGLAVGHATGEIYVPGYVGRVAGGVESVVAVFDGSGSLLATWTGADTPGKAFTRIIASGEGRGEVTGVAVDDSAGGLGDWAAGDVYVANEFGYEQVEAGAGSAVDVFKPGSDGKEEYVTRLTEGGGESFGRVEHVAVDQLNGDVLVATNGVVDVFEPAAGMPGLYTFLFQLTGSPSQAFSYIEALVGDGKFGDIYVLTQGVVDEFSPSGVYLGHITGEGTPGGGFQRPEAVAVDPSSGDVYVYDERELTEGSVIDRFGPNITVPDAVTEAASSVGSRSATLNGEVNPDNEGPATCQFDWGTSGELGEVQPCERALEGGALVPVSVKLERLRPDTTYYYRLQASNRNGTNPGGPSREFTTPGPGMHGESVSDVTSTSVLFQSTIDPHDAPTSSYFQYGQTTSYGGEVPAAPGVPLGSGESDVETTRLVQGLAPGTVYHYRVVAVSEVRPGVLEVFEGPDQTFRTQPPGSALVLPDGRRWEMVSPPDKHGASIEGLEERRGPQAAASGDAIAYMPTAPTEAEPQGFGNNAQDLSTRGPEGWTTRDIKLPSAQATGVTLGKSEYAFFSDDLSLGLVEPVGPIDPSLSVEVSEKTPILRTDYLNGNVDEPCLPPAMDCYRPIVTGKPGYANVEQGTVFGGEGGPEVMGVTPDLSHIVIYSSVPLMKGGGNLYEWVAGRLTNLGTSAANSGRNIISSRHGISKDGSRVVFVGEYEGYRGLLMRDTETNQTVQLDALQGGKLGREEGLAEARVWGASSDGSRVFFTDDNPLTANSGSHYSYRSTRADLYECRMVEREGRLHCELTDLTPLGPSGEPAYMEGVMGVSEDGSYVYFVAGGALMKGATPGTDLYVYHDGVTKLIAALSGADAMDWSRPGHGSGFTSRVSPNGEWLAFMSQQELTGYDTLDAVSGKPDEEVYLYRASTGHLVCASCNPTGARPVGSEAGSLVDGPVGSSDGLEEGQWVAANVPGWTPHKDGEPSFYQSRYLSNGGRLFFNSDDALVPQDVDGTWNVFEYEPEGFADEEGRVQCTGESVTYSERAGGCVGMISSGTSAQESVFLDASESGGDVFFLTTAKLAPQDYDTAYDIYDAHECTSAAPCYPVPATVPPPCTTGDACKASPTPQPTIFGAPSSETFSGAGNIVPSSPPAVRAKGLTRAQKRARALRACAKKSGARRRAECERQARARYASRTRRARSARKGGRA